MPICRLIGLALDSWLPSRVRLGELDGQLCLALRLDFGGLGQAPPLSCSVPRDETRFAELTTSADQRDVVGAFTRLARLSQSAKASRFHASGACKYGLNSVADEREQAQSLLSPSFPRKDKQAHPHSNSVYASAPAANSGSRGELRDFTALSRHPVPLAAGIPEAVIMGQVDWRRGCHAATVTAVCVVLISAYACENESGTHRESSG